MDARFRVFRNGNGRVRVWPPVEFPTRPIWPGATKVIFENATDELLTFADPGNALAPGQTLAVDPRSTGDFKIKRDIDPGAYVFEIRTPTREGQDTEKLAFVADNPEIIIVG
jgi:hypothetical protein